MRHLLALCLALFCVCAVAETYRWVDPSGHIIISDTPPPGKARDVNHTGNQPAASSSDDIPFAVRKARENYPVTLYTAANCLDECQQARDLLNGRGVPFTEKMLQKAEDAAELKALVGDTALPSLKVGSQSFRGFEANAYNNLLDLAGYPKTTAHGSKPSGNQAPTTEPGGAKNEPSSAPGN